MKSAFLTLACALAVLTAPAQTRKAAKAPEAPKVSAATVARVVRTLAADDMQGRGTGQPGGVKAAQFLAGEFQRIGLQPLPGTTGFEQVFTAYQTQPGPLSVLLNGQAVAPGKAVASSAQPTLTWTSEDAQRATLVTIGPGEAELRKLNKELFAPAANTLVLIDTSQAKVFNRVATVWPVAP
jgi:hypothetical protein